jgi:SulP family sulfate permease
VNQELIGLGVANFGAGNFQSFSVGGSLSRSAANDRAGAHSQMSGIIAAALTAIVALFFTQFFYALPEAALGAIVLVAVSGMVKIVKLKHLYHVRHADGPVQPAPGLFPNVTSGRPAKDPLS